MLCTSPCKGSSMRHLLHSPAPLSISFHYTILNYSNSFFTRNIGHWLASAVDKLKCVVPRRSYVSLILGKINKMPLYEYTQLDSLVFKMQLIYLYD